MTRRIRACLGLFPIAPPVHAPPFPPPRALPALPSSTLRHRMCHLPLPSLSPRPPSLMLRSPPPQPLPLRFPQRPLASAFRRHRQRSSQHRRKALPLTLPMTRRIRAYLGLFPIATPVHAARFPPPLALPVLPAFTLRHPKYLLPLPSLSPRPPLLMLRGPPPQPLP